MFGTSSKKRTGRKFNSVLVCLPIMHTYLPYGSPVSSHPLCILTYHMGFVPPTLTVIRQSASSILYSFACPLCILTYHMGFRSPAIHYAYLLTIWDSGLLPLCILTYHMGFVPPTLTVIRFKRVGGSASAHKYIYRSRNIQPSNFIPSPIPALELIQDGTGLEIMKTLRYRNV